MNLLTEGFLLGLSSGVFCLGYCAPVLLPFLHAKEKPGWRSRTRPLVAFALGRLAAYLIFGYFVGWVGAQINQSGVRIGLAVAFLLLSLLLLAYGLSLNLPRFETCRRFSRFSEAGYFPLLLGILTGLNVCPPFLLASERALQHGKPLAGLVLFLAFYFGTILYLLPFVFTQLLTRMEQVRLLAQMVALGAGVIFSVMALVQLANLL
jgi:sulfite exporter TauE/SafE